MHALHGHLSQQWVPSMQGTNIAAPALLQRAIIVNTKIVSYAEELFLFKPEQAKPKTVAKRGLSSVAVAGPMRKQKR